MITVQVTTDDEIFDVDAHYLGPPGRYLGRVRYKTLVLFPALFFPLITALYMLGVPMTLISWAAAGMVVLRFVQIVSKHFTPMTPFLAVATQLIAETHAPRKRITRASMPVTTHRVRSWVGGIDQTVLPRPSMRTVHPRRHCPIPDWSEQREGHDD